MTSQPCRSGAATWPSSARFAQNDALRPAEPIPPDPFTERLFTSGNAFEDEVVAEILHLNFTTLTVAGDDAAAREAATVLALSDGATPILSARLPNDLAGRRVGRPDLLVAAAGGGYRAVDIKWHQSLEPSTGKASELPGLCGGLGSLGHESAAIDPDYAARKSQSDLLQLAHYQRMLEAAGYAAARTRYGGIIGTERRVVWYDLDAPIWRTPSSTGATKLRTTMERYDFEFDFRLDIVAVAERHLLDSDVELLVVPVRCGECPGCPWNGYCAARLEAGSGDVSLLPRIGWNQWKIHREHGVTDRAGLAALDWRTGWLVAAGIDLTGLRVLAASLPPETPVLDLGAVWKPARHLETLDARGVRTAGDVLALDATTVAYSGCGMTLHEQIDLARAALGPEAVYLRRGVGVPEVPRGDIEVDVDMESSEVGVYLWGCLLTDRTGPGTPTREYRSFVTWEALTPEREAANSLKFWHWLMDVRASAQEGGLSFRAYCYNAGAENQYLRRLGLSAGLEADVAAFIASDEWVDLLEVWNRQFITGTSSGLKTVAPLVGHVWEVGDAGGAVSMVWYDLAVAGDQAARRWLFDYNRGDVEATLALRDWVGSTQVPRVKELAEPFSARS